MVQRDHVPNNVNDIEQYLLQTNALDTELYGVNNLNDAVRTGPITNEFSIVPKDESVLRDFIYEDGTYTRPVNSDVNFTNGTYTITTEGANSANRVDLETTSLGLYRSGAVSLAGIYTQKDSLPLGRAEWGIGRYNGGNQIFVRYESDGTVSLVVERGGVETVIPQSEWNENNKGTDITDENGNHSGKVYGFDQMDGDGPSGIDLDPSIGYIYRFDYSWYGGGAITLNIVSTDDDGYQRAFPVVSFQTEEQVSVHNPNQPVFCRLDNEGDTSSDSINVGGRQYSVVGNFTDEKRKTSHFQNSVTIGTGETALFSFRRKTGYEGVELELDQLDILPSADILIYPVIDATLSTPTWSAPTRNQAGTAVDSDETAIEVTSASMTAGSGIRFGNPIIVAGGGNAKQSTQSGEDTLRIPIPRQMPVTLVAEALGGSSTSATVFTTIEERW